MFQSQIALFFGEKRAKAFWSASSSSFQCLKFRVADTCKAALASNGRRHFWATSSELIEFSYIMFFLAVSPICHSGMVLAIAVGRIFRGVAAQKSSIVQLNLLKWSWSISGVLSVAANSWGYHSAVSGASLYLYSCTVSREGLLLGAQAAVQMTAWVSIKTDWSWDWGESMGARESIELALGHGCVHMMDLSNMRPSVKLDYRGIWEGSNRSK